MAPRLLPRQCTHSRQQICCQPSMRSKPCRSCRLVEWAWCTVVLYSPAWLVVPHTITPTTTIIHRRHQARHTDSQASQPGDKPLTMPCMEAFRERQPNQIMPSFTCVMPAADDDLFGAVVRKHPTSGYSEETVRRIFRRVVLAVQAVHKAGMLHRDLKPGEWRRVCVAQQVHLRVVLMLAVVHGTENLLVWSDSISQVTLCDFGLVRMPSPLEDVYAYNRVGSLDFLAPELLKHPYECELVWRRHRSIGVTLAFTSLLCENLQYHRFRGLGCVCTRWYSVPAAVWLPPVSWRRPALPRQGHHYQHSQWQSHVSVNVCWVT